VDIRGSNPVTSHLQSQKEALEMEVKKLEKVNRELLKSKEAQEEEGKALLAEMDEISKAFEEMQEQNDRILQQMEEKHDTSSRLVKEKLRARKIQQKMSDETTILQEKNIRLAEKIEAQVILIRSTEAKLRSLQELLTRAQEDSRLCQTNFESQKKTLERRKCKNAGASRQVSSLTKLAR